MGQYIEFYTGVLKKWNVFSGRARRREYWMFALINFIIFTILGVLSQISGIFTIVSTLLSLVLLVPSLAVGIRRLHDTDRSGWALLLALIPLVGFIILLVFFIQEGTSGDNKYGPDPKA